MRLLIGDDDARSGQRRVFDLAALGHEAVLVADGRSAVLRAAADSFDALLIDGAIAQLDGVAVVRELRGQGVGVAIVLRSADDTLEQRIAALDAGADDVVGAAVDPREIVARVRAILRRAARAADAGVLRAGDIVINEAQHRAERAGRPLTLPKLEFRLLCELVRHRGGVVSRASLYARVWNTPREPATNRLESAIRRVRAQLCAGGAPDPIVTVRGVGYGLVEHP